MNARLGFQPHSLVGMHSRGFKEIAFQSHSLLGQMRAFCLHLGDVEFVQHLDSQLEGDYKENHAKLAKNRNLELQDLRSKKQEGKPAKKGRASGEYPDPSLLNMQNQLPKETEEMEEDQDEDEKDEEGYLFR